MHNYGGIPENRSNVILYEILAFTFLTGLERCSFEWHRNDQRLDLTAVFIYYNTGSLTKKISGIFY